MDQQKRSASDDVSSELSEPSSEHPSTTTISTVAVQAGKAKIVLAILRSNEWIRVRIQQMEPDLMEVGASLEEARALRREHDELLVKLNLKQKDVTELLARADDLSTQNKSYQEVYAAMAESLGEAWKDLNAQLEYRKMLLDQSIAFHESANMFSHKMETASSRFSSSGLAPDVETARRLLQQHQELKKGILEASMATLQEGQSLLQRIREMGMHADVQNRHATTAACYGIEYLLELLQDRRRHLEELWLQRKVRLEQHLQLLLLDTEVQKVNDWFSSVGDVHLNNKELGDSASAAQNLQTQHMQFELQARGIQETVLRLVRTADQLIHSAHYDAEGVRQRLRNIDEKCEDFMLRLDNRRKNLALAISFFLLAQTALAKLDEIEAQLNSTDLPRNSSALAERHAYLSNAILDTSTPALREGRILLERVGREHPQVQGVGNKMTELQERVAKLESMCKAKYEAGEKSQAYQEFTEKYATVSSWLNQIGQATLSRHHDMGGDLYTARDFLELHERLDEDMRDKTAEVEGLMSAAQALGSSGEPEHKAAVERSSAVRQEWSQLLTLIEQRIHLALKYTNFHKKAQQLALQMDALEQYLKIEKMDPTEVTESAIKHKEQKHGQMNNQFKDVETNGKSFIKEAKEVKNDNKLNTRRAITVTETILSQFQEKMYMITDYYEHWKVHVSTGKEFKSQWHQFVQDARKTIDHVMEIEKELFVPFISANLGKSLDEVKKQEAKLTGFKPKVEKAQAEIEEHLKTAEMLSLKGDTKGQKDQIVNELLKVHTRFQARITEFQLLINMAIKFFKNLSQLDDLIKKTETEYSKSELPKELTKAELMLREHQASRDKIGELIKFTTEEGEQIVVRVRQQDSEAIAKDEVQKVLLMTEERRRAWENAWEQQRNKLEQNLQISQFYFDLRALHGELDELHRHLEARRGQYGSSLSNVVMTSQAFKQFELTVQVIEKKITQFVSTAEMMIREQHYDSRRIRHEVDQVQKKWSAFFMSIGNYRQSLDASTKFFELIETCEDWTKEASQFLLQIGRKAAECKTSQDAVKLVQQLDAFRNKGATEQNDRLSTMQQIIVELYGPVQGPPKMQHAVDKTQDVMNSFIKAIEELAILRENLARTEEIIAEVGSVVEARVPKKPRFSQPLQNAEITEGQRFTFECRVECESTPKMEWFKDDMPLNSPDYQTTFTRGTATLTIEETFSEDTAKYTCRASTPEGTVETTATLRVKETHQKITPPDFSKQLKSSDIPEGTQFMLECHVTGIPTPTVSWFKDDVNIDNSPDYVITKINGTCGLKIRRATPEHSARYTCKASNPGGEAASSARLNVISVKKPQFRETLKNVTAKEGQLVKLEVVFHAEPAPQIQWLRGDAPILPSAVFKIIVETNYTALEINEVYPEDSGTYTCIAKNLGGETRTSCLLTVEALYSEDQSMSSDVEPTRPRFVQPLQDREVLEGNRARLDCVIVAHPEPEVIWFHNDRPVKESKDFQLLFEGDRCSLIIREVYLEDSGEYRCFARNAHGQAENKCRLVVEPLSEVSDISTASVTSEVVPPKFTQLLKDLEGVEGSKVRFECRVIGHPMPLVKWFRENQEIIASTDFQVTQERELYSLTIPEVFKEDAGNFVVKATNAAGEAKCYASLNVRKAGDTHVVKTRLVESSHMVQRKSLSPGLRTAPPEFKKMFNDMRVMSGKPCRLEVVVTGNPRPKVTWFFNNEPVVSPDYQVSSFGDNHSLYIPEVFDEDAGRFSVTAENEAGKATCSALLVVVDESAAPPKVPSPPMQQQPSMVVPQRVVPAAHAPPPMAPPPFMPPKPVAPEPIVAQPMGTAFAAPAPGPPRVSPKPTFPQVDVKMELPVPPKFVEALKNISADEGTQVVFQGVVDGKPEPSIKWFKSGHDITNNADFEITFKDKRVSLKIPEAFVEDSGTYQCAAANTAGAAKSTAELIVKASMIPPQFLERLQTREVQEGEAVRFTVRVRGKPPPHVKWFREGSQIVSSPDFEIIKEGEVHSLYIPEVFYEDSGKFSVKAENPAGQATCTAELIVEAPSGHEESASPSPPVSRSPSVGTSPAPLYHATIPPQFTRPLRNSVVGEGERVVLECIVPAHPPPDRVQWFRDQQEITPSNDYQIGYQAGVCSLVIAEVFPEDTGRFTCTVTVGGISNSTNMFLRVDAAPAAPPAVSPRPQEVKPAFINALTNQPLAFGATAYFECRVKGYPPPEILWTRRGHPLVDKTRYKSTYDQYNGITTLTILNLQEADEGEYTCTAINSLGECSTSALLLGPDRYQAWLAEQGRPQPPPVAVTPVVPAHAAPSPRAGPPVGAAPGPDSFYRPAAEKVLDATSEAPDYDDPDKGFKVSHFETRLMKEVEFREGRIDPRSIPGVHDREALDPSIPMDRTRSPRVEQPLSNFQLMEGSDATFVCKVSGVPRPNVQWFHNGRQLKPSNRYEMKYSREGYCSLRVRVAFPEDAGYYTVCATNIVGRDTSSAELYIEGLTQIDDTSYVNPETLRRMQKRPSSRGGSRDPGGVSEKYYKPVFRKVPMDQEVNEGQMVRFDCVVTGRPMPELFWYRDGERVRQDHLHNIVINEGGINSLIIHRTQKHDTGTYTCVARNRAGEDSFTVGLNVIPHREAQIPKFIARLHNLSVREGDPVVLSAEATGVPTPMIAWQKDGKMITSNDPTYKVETEGGKTSLLIESATPRDDAWYQCNAVNVAGSASNRARLVVQVEARRPEPPRKLVIPKRTTPTPTQDRITPVMDRPAYAPAPPRAPTPTEMSRAHILLTPTSPAPPAIRPTVISPAPIVMATPKPAPVVTYVKPEPSTDKPDGPARMVSELTVRPSTRELIKRGLEPEPSQEDMWSADRVRPPHFKTPIQPQLHLLEAQPAHFECRLVPINDPDMQVEWYKDGQPLRAGSRFKTTFDFGYVGLDILWTYPEDNGMYTVRAINKHGQDQTHAELRCKPKKSVITHTQLPPGVESVRHIQVLEESLRRDAEKYAEMREREPKRAPPPEEEGQDNAPPTFERTPEAVRLEEGDTAKFLVKVNGYPRPRLTWWVNGAIVVNSHRFKLRYDGMIHILEMPRVREYDNGTVRVVAKNPHGEAECSTTLSVIPREDWRARLKQAPQSIAQLELEKRRSGLLQRTHDYEALYKKTTRKTETMEGGAPLRPGEEVHMQVHLHQMQQQREPDRHISRITHDRKEPPTFTAPIQPVAVKEGHAAKFSVEFIGSPPPVIQWFREGFEIQTSRDFQIMTTPTRSTLYIPEVFPEDTGMFTVKVHNQYGMAQCKAMLQVQEDDHKERECPPEFRVQMRDISTRVGEPATFDCQIQGYPRPEVYWTKDGQRLPESPRRKFIIEDDHYTLLIYEVREDDRGTYECVVVNKMGKATCSAKLIVQGTVTALVKPTAPVAGMQAPQLIEPMRDQFVDEGQPTVFKCKIIAHPAPVIQWYYNNQAIKPSKYFRMTSEGGVQTLHITGAFPEDQGVYKCQALNQAGEVTCIAHLKVNALSSEPEPDLQRQMAPPRFVQPINSMEPVENAPVRFETVVEGQPKPQVTWFREGHQIVPSNDFQIKTEGPKNVLLIPKVMVADTGVFTCRASNPAGVAECSAELIVIDAARAAQRKPPQIIKGPSPVRELQTGNNTKIVVQIEAFPPPKFSWFVNGRPVVPSQRFKVNYENGIITLVIFNVQPEDSGDYILRASNECGECTWKTTLNVKPSEKVVQLPTGTTDVSITTKQKQVVRKELTPTFLRPLQPEVKVTQNNVARLECEVQAYPAPRITWHVNGLEIKPSNKYRTTYVNNVSVLEIQNVNPQDTGTYTCRAVSDIGEAVSSTTLYVLPTQEVKPTTPPKFTRPLRDTTAVDGDELVLSAVVTGNPTPHVSWFHNNENIDRSEDFVLNFDRATGRCECVIVECLPDDQGSFRCVAENPTGRTETRCELTIKPPTKPPGSEDLVEPEMVERAHAPPPPTKPEEFKESPPKTLEQPELPAEPTKDPVSEDTIVPVPREGDKVAPKVTRKQEVTVEGQNIIEQETDHITEVKVIKKVVKKESGEPPRFSRPIQPQVVKEGEDATFTAVVSGVPTPEVAWLKDKKMIGPTDRIKMTYNPDTQTCSMVIHNATQEDIGVYSCRASNPAGKATCTANVVVVPPDAEVTVTEKTVSVKKEKVTIVGESETRVVETSPQFTTPLPPNTNAHPGDNINLECEVSGEPEPKVTWFKDGRELCPTKHVGIKRDQGRCVLTIFQAGPEDSGEYVCNSHNMLGEATTKTLLIVNIRDKQPVGPLPLEEPAVAPEKTPQAQRGPPPGAPRPGEEPSVEVPPQPLTEPCAVISMTHQQMKFTSMVKPEQEAPRFTLPLRDQCVDDGDKVIMKVMFRGNPRPTVTWYFNSQPIKPSADFQIKVDQQKNESTLTIVEVFPDDEGEYICKAENPLGTAVTHCHLFVKLPSSSDDEVEKIVSKTVETVTTKEPVKVKEKSQFKETISLEHKGRYQPYQMQFALPEPRRERTDLYVRQESAPQGYRMEFEVPRTQVQTKSVQLKKSIMASPTMREQLKMPLLQQRRFSETIAIDNRPKPKEVELQFKIPEPRREVSKLTVNQQAALKGMRMEVEIAAQKQQISQTSLVTKRRATAIGTERRQVTLQLEGEPPRYIVNLPSFKVMDGEEVKFKAEVVGNPMPEVTWFRNGRLVEENPDFRTYYDRKTGEVMLHIIEVFPQDTGEYMAVAANKYGRAVTTGYLQVDVFEYIPDSEEASQSQTESVMSSGPDRKDVSEDELEFLERTQAFIANMQKLRQEIRDEQVEEEEVEMTEHHEEEVVQMADVKWQIPKKVEEKPIVVSEEVAEEIASTAFAEQPKETKEVVVDLAQPYVQAEPTHRTQVLTEVVQPDTLEEVDAPAQPQQPTEQQIVVELASHVRQVAPSTHVQTVEEKHTTEVTTELVSQVSETTQEHTVQIAYVQPTPEPRPEVQATPVAQEEPVPEEVAPAPEQAPREEPQQPRTITVELTQPVEHPAPEIKSAPVLEEQIEAEPAPKAELPPQIMAPVVQPEVEKKPEPQPKPEEIIEPEPQPVVEHKPEPKPEPTPVTVEPVEEKVTEDITTEMSTVEHEVGQEQQIVVELVQPEKPEQTQYVVQPTEEQIKEELVYDQVESTSEEKTQQDEYKVELVTSFKEPAKQTVVQEVEEKVSEDVTTELTTVTHEVGKEQQIIVELTRPEQPKKTPYVVQPSEEQVKEELVYDQVESTTEEKTQEEEYKVELVTSVKEPAKQTVVHEVEEKVPEDEGTEITSVIEEVGQEQQIVVELTQPKQPEKTQYVVQPTEEQVKEELVYDQVESTTEEKTQEEEYKVELVESTKEHAPQTVVQELEEKVPEDITGEITQTVEEIGKEEQIVVELTQPKQPEKTQYVVQPTEEQVKEELVYDQVESTTEEKTQEDEYKVELVTSVKEPAKQTVVQEVEEKVPEDEGTEITSVVEEVGQEQQIVVEMVQPEQPEKTQYVVQPTEEQVKEELVYDQVESTTEEKTQQEEYKVELVQEPATEHAPQSVVLPVEEEVAPDMTSELEEGPLEEVGQEKVEEVELTKEPTREQVPHTLTQVVEEEVAEDLTAEIQEQPTEQTSEQPVQVEMTQHVSEPVAPSLVQPVEEQLTEEVTSDLPETTPGETGEQRETPAADLVQPTAEHPTPASVVQPVEESIAPEETTEVAEPVPEQSQEEQVTVELVEPAREQPKENLVQTVEEQISEEVTTEVVALTEETGQEQQIVVQLSEPTKEEAPTSVVQEVEESISHEITTEVVELTEEQTQEQQVIVELTTTTKEDAKQSLVGTVEEEIPHEETYEVAPQVEEVGQEQQIVVELSALEPQAPQESMVQTVEEQVSEEIITEVVALDEETGQEEQIMVQLVESTKEEVPSTVVQPVEESVPHEETYEVAPQVEEVGQEEQITVDLAQPGKESPQQSMVQTVEEQVSEEVTTEVVALVEETPTEENITVEMSEPTKQPAEGSMVKTVQEEVSQEATEEIGRLSPETTNEERVVVEFSSPETEEARQSLVTAVEEDVTVEAAPEDLSPAPEGSEPNQEDTVVDLAQHNTQHPQGFLAGAQTETFSEEQPDEAEITELTTEVTTPAEVQVTLDTHQRESPQRMQTMTLQEQLPEEGIEESQERIPTPESSEQQEVTAEFVEPSVEECAQTRIEQVEERLSEGSVEENIEALRALSPQAEEVAVEMSQPSVQPTEMTHTDYVEERISSEEEEDMFFETEEPEIPGEEVTVDLGTAALKDKPSQSAQPQEEVLPEEGAEDAHAEYMTEETLPEEVAYTLSEAEKEAPKPSLVGTQEQVVEPQAAEKFETQVTEETGDETKVEVDLSEASRESPKPSHVTSVEETHEVITTKEDVVEFTEEESHPEEIHVDLSEGGLIARPTQNVNPLLESVAPDNVAEELSTSIKEIYMIPSMVRPEYEPAVVERYRLETQIRASSLEREEDVTHRQQIIQKMQQQQQQTHSVHMKMQVEATADSDITVKEIAMDVEPQVEMIAAQMAQQIVRAAHEVTEGREVIAEVTTEQIEIIKKPEVKVTETVTKEVSAVSLMAPVFEIPLQDITVFDGEPAVFECRVTGVPRPEVTWFVDSQEIKLSADFELRYEEGVCTLRIKDALPEDEGEYSVKAVNDAGTCVTTAYLTVLPPSRSESEPEIPLVEPELVTHAEAGVPQKPEKPEEETHKVEVTMNVQTPKEVSVIEVPIPVEAVPSAPTFVSQLQHKEVFETMPITLECSVTGQPEPTITWYQDGKKVTSTEHTYIEFKKGRCTLTIDRVTLEDEAEYTCEATNTHGVATTIAELLVEKLVSAVEQVVSEEFFEIEIEMFFKWRVTPKSEVSC